MNLDWRQHEGGQKKEWVGVMGLAHRWEDN